MMVLSVFAAALSLAPLVALAPPQSVSVRVGKSDSVAAARARAEQDSLRRERERRRSEREAPRRIPLTPELERTAFRDPQAKSLLLLAREARLRQDSALLSYDATAYQRLSVGFGF